MGRRIQETGEGLEREVEEKIRTVVSKIKDPLIEELDTMRDQVERLGSRIDAQMKRLKKQDQTEGDEETSGSYKDAGEG